MKCPKCGSRKLDAEWGDDNKGNSGDVFTCMDCGTVSSEYDVLDAENNPPDTEVNEMITRKSWQSFRDTGLVTFVNSFLHIFGWALVFEADGEKILSVYPARVKFRGFDDKSTDRAYKKLSKYMEEHASELKAEADE
jgi:hypothetical protein